MSFPINVLVYISNKCDLSINVLNYLLNCVLLMVVRQSNKDLLSRVTCNHSVIKYYCEGWPFWHKYNCLDSLGEHFIHGVALQLLRQLYSFWRIVKILWSIQKHTVTVHVSAAPEITKVLLIRVLSYKCFYGCLRIMGRDWHSCIYHWLISIVILPSEQRRMKVDMKWTYTESYGGRFFLVFKEMV